MRNIEVCLSPDLLGLYSLKGKLVVVIDILRATSCMVSGLASGVQGVVAVATTEEVLPFKQNGYVTAGERDGSKIEGFDIGNSPFEHMAHAGSSIVMTTTNGTKAISLSWEAEEIVIGSFLNISAVAAHLLAREQDVLLVCSGWKGRPSLEDTLFAGALLARLPELERTDDSSYMAEAIYAQAATDLEGYVRARAAHVARLSKLGIDKDITFCLTFDKFDNVPVVQEGLLTNYQA